MFNMKQQETGKPDGKHMPCVTSACEPGPVSEPFQVLFSALGASCGDVQHSWGALTLYYYYFK